jgi:hypothetical protein
MKGSDSPQEGQLHHLRPRSPAEQMQKPLALGLVALQQESSPPFDLIRHHHSITSYTKDYARHIQYINKHTVSQSTVFVKIDHKQHLQ